MALADLRREYTQGGLRRADLDPDAIVQFRKWFDQAAEVWKGSPPDALIGEVNAVTLATADKAGHPSARVVLLKGVGDRGFAFFTNYHSRKARDLSENPHAALVIHWPNLERQICIAGSVTRLSVEESEAYFRTRPRASRLAAWASEQSEPVEDRGVLEKRWEQLNAQYPGEDVPKPPHWGGYVLTPTRIEFWQGRPSRLHDRFCYSKQSDGRWHIERLAP